MRARDVESGVPLEYLQLLHRGYEEFIDDISRSTPVIRVPWEEFRDTSEVVKVVEEAFSRDSFIRDAVWRPTSL